MLNLTRHAIPRHWSSAYVGKPWALGAEGPDAFDCWGLSRWVQDKHYGRALPVMRVGELRSNPSEEQTRTLLELMRNGGWVNLPDWHQMMDGDLLRMKGPTGPHIGIVVSRHHAHLLSVLHSTGHVKDGVNFGAVEVATPHQLVTEGYGRFEAWRWSE